jgi:phosphate:Na+ symporter
MDIGYWIETVIFMFAAIGALLLGFELLSSNITKLFHTGLKKLFNKTQKNAIIGVGIGAAATAIMQSSGATTVMIVGFVNTGIINLAQATALIMGANIGTTITAQLAALSSFDFGAYAIFTAGLGAFITMLGKKDRTKTIGNALTGFGILILGLECMSLAIKNPDAEGNKVVFETIKNLLSTIDGQGAWIILFLLGIVLTALVQSSSLITTIIISLVSAGIYIGAGENATSLTNNVLFLILGSNIGSCVTALISSMGADTNAKRASVIHILFNTFGAVIFAILLLLWPTFMEDTFVKWFSGEGAEATQIAMFHTFFNVACTLIFLPFINIFVKVSEVLVRDKKTAKEPHRLIYLDERILATPSIAVHQVRKELALMYSKSVEALNISIDAFLNKDNEQRENVDLRIEELEFTNKQIIEFMVKVTNESIAFEDECTLSAFHRTLNDILRIAEIGDNICKYANYMVKHELEFSPNVMLQLGFMKNKINELYIQTDEVFLTKNLNKLHLADALEDEVDQMRKNLIDDHFDRLNRGECKPQNSGVFVNLVNNLERAADHMIYIAYSVKEASEQAKNK